MTGFGRTSLSFAFQHAAIKPDFICIAKGLTALHSHTQSGNVLAASVALENLKILEEENIYAQVRKNEQLLHSLMQEVGSKTNRLQNIRNIGAIVAADLILDQQQKTKRYGYKIFQAAVKLGVFLRPLGNTIYWLPPLNSKKNTLQKLSEITIQAINLIMQ